VFAAAERTGAPLLVHPKLDESLHPAVFRTHRLNGIFGREAALAASICTVVHEGVLDRHPDLVLVYHHSGGNIASAMGRLHNQLDPGRWPHGDTAVYDDAEHLEPFETFKRTIEERIYLDTAGYHGYHQPLAAMLSEFPASQVLLGSDGPIETRTPEELADMVEAVGEVTSGTDSRRILGENALALLVNR
jgi:predicted TIM-barrel fold metal-dependent hydrolase